MASSTPPPPADETIRHDDKIKSKVFSDAYRRFVESLSPKEQLLYSPSASHDDFMNAMRKLEDVVNQRRKRGGLRFLDRIGRLSDRLQPFFGVVNIMIQSNPEYTALAWGALRFILQLASSFKTFFEKLIVTLECFCNEIPRYEHLQDLVQKGGQISTRIKECTEKVYGYMFQFFGEVTNVFTSDGRLKRTPVVIADILWRPFDHRFDSLLKQIQSCRSLIEFDILLLQAQVANDTKAIASVQKEISEKEREERKKAQEKLDEQTRMTEEKARKDALFHRDTEQLLDRIQIWLSPPQYSDALFHGKSLREPGTNEWILTNPRFREWREREWAINPSGQRRKCGSNILWVNGNPGTGKSVLASSVIDELMKEYRQDNQRWELCYFFFSLDYKDSTNRISAYRSILAQILHRNRQDDETINKFDFTMTDPHFSGTPKAGLDELFGLAKLLFQQFQILLVLDGIDECEDNSSLIGEIMELSDSSSAKILLCGRTNTESLIRTVPTSLQICLDRDTVHADVRLFISTQVDVLLDDELLPPDANSEDLINLLCRGADGMFLWAKLMFKYLGLPVHDQYSRLKVIWSVVSPEGLEKMYARIVRSISQAGETWRDFAGRILAWASYSLRPLTLEELYDQMTFDTPNTTKVGSDELKAFEQRVCIVCQGLIEFSKVPSQNPAHKLLRYIHLSVKEHFSRGLQGFESQDPLVSPEAVGHLTSASKCLEYILYHVPARQTRLGHPEPKDSALGAFSGYAARNWVMHLDWSFFSASSNALDVSSALMRLAPNLSHFLQHSTNIKFWIHVLYNHSNPCTPDGISLRLDELVLTLSGSHCFPASMGELSATLQRFCQDVSKELKVWDKHLSESTDILWDEMVIFSESPFLVGPRKGQVMSMAPAPPPGNIHPNSSLVRKVSHTGAEGKSTAVVSTWQNLRSSTKSVVKYELWKHDTVPTRLSEIINLMEHQQTFDTYPISISDNLGSFVVMDTLFVLLPNGNAAPVSTHSAKIPVTYGHNTPPMDICTNFFKISTQGQFLLSSDSSINFSHGSNQRTCFKITMFEIQNEAPLQVNPILFKNFKIGDLSEVLEAIFHPSHPVVIMRGETWIAAWAFAKEYRDKPGFSFEVLYEGGRVTKMLVSSCGKFVVFERKSGPLIHKTLPIPERFFAPDLTGFNKLAASPRSDLKWDKSTTESLLSPRQGLSTLQLSPGRPVQPNQILTSANGRPARLISVQGGKDVRITRTDLQSKRADEVLNIIRLPQGMNGASPTILAPALGDESIRIILNENGRGEERETNELPVFISRDINAIKHTLYDGARQQVDGRRAVARQQIRNREESESEQVPKRRRTGTI